MKKNKKRDKDIVRNKILTKLIIGDDRDFFIENLSMLLSSGMDVLSALNSIKDEISTKKMRLLIDGVIEGVESGVLLSDALDSANIFHRHTISLIKIGEESGRLPENFEIIVDQQMKSRLFRSKLRSATMYPLFVLFLTIVVGIGVAWFVLPTLARVFSQLKIELPLVTEILIVSGNFLSEWGDLVVPMLFIFIFFLFYFVFIFGKTKFIGQYFLLYLPMTKRIVQSIELARMGHLFGGLLRAGVPITTSIDSLVNTTANYLYKDFYIYLRDSISLGNSFSQSFELYPRIKMVVPSFVRQMIVAGEQSGNLSETLIKIGAKYEEKTDNMTKSFMVILEPIFLVFVWMGVVFVAIGVILPIYGLVGGF